MMLRRSQRAIIRVERAITEGILFAPGNDARGMIAAITSIEVWSAVRLAHRDLDHRQG